MENNAPKAYQPEVGANNRYENSRTSNKELAEQINQEALGVVNNAMSVLEKIRKDKSMKNFHDEKTDGQWMGEWLVNQKKKILDLYGVVQLDHIMADHLGVPKEIENFVKDVYQTVEM
jgi:hypothetical protein